MNKIGIVVDYTPFDSVTQAAFAEQKVDWWNTEDTRIRACVECYAAWEISQHLEKMMGGFAKFEMVFLCAEQAEEMPVQNLIWVGRNAFSKKLQTVYSTLNLPAMTDREEYHLLCLGEDEKRHWLLDGNTPHGTLYAAYELLEHWGIRWFGSGEKDLYLPKISSLDELFEKNLCVSDKPKFKTRGIYNEFIDDSDLPTILWTARMRANFWFCDKIHNPHLLKKLGFGLTAGGHIIQPDYLNPDTIGEDGVHTYAQLHPEWYGLFDGKRQFEFGEEGVEGYNFCTSNEQAVETLCNNVVESLVHGKLKHVDYLNFWMLDMGKWCQCESCKNSGNYTSRLLQVVAQLQKKIKESRAKGELKREIRVLFPAYLETLQPPDKPIPEGFDYELCLPTFFPIERCYLHYIDDSRCTETNVEIMRAFRPWATDEARNYRGELFLGEYFNVSPFANLPFQFTEILKHDIPYYYEAGIRHFYFFHFPTGEIGPLRWTNYLVYKMLWNPYLDVDQQFEEYFHLFFQDAPYIREIYAQLEMLSKNAKYFKHYQIRNGERLSLNEKLEVLNNDLMPMLHMQLDEVNEEQGGISFYQMVQQVQECRLMFNRALFEQKGIIAERLLADERRFTYLEQMVMFLFYFTLSEICYDQGRVPQARLYYQKA